MEGRWTLVRGLLSLGVGIFAFARPEQLFVTVLCFGALAVVAGFLAIVHAVRLPREHAAGRWVLLAEGIAGIALGALTFEFVRKTIFLAYTIGAWAIVIGAGTLALAVVLRHLVRPAWLWGLIGALVAILGMGLVLDPAAAALGPSYILGLAATVSGIAQLAIGMGLLHHGKALPS